jgi:TRAP transporter TAXI family solute receptor
MTTKTLRGPLTSLAALMALAAPATATDLVFLAGSPGGSWFPTAGAISTALEEISDEISVQVRPGGGVANIEAINQGVAQVALSTTISAVDAVNGREPFSGPVESICNVAYLYPAVVQIAVVNTEFDEVADFADGKLAVVPRGNTAEAVARLTLESVGLTYDDLDQVNFASMSDQVNMMKDGQVDGFFQATGVPAGVIMDVGASRDLKLLPVSDEMFASLKEANAGFQQHEIPAGTYPFMDEAVQTVSFGTHVIADCGLDDDTVYTLTRAIYEGLDDIKMAVAVLKDTTQDQLGVDVGIRQHPGSARFFAEIE